MQTDMNIETIKALCPEFAATALRTSRVKERVRRFDAVDGLFFLSGTKDRSMVAKSWSREDAELFAVAEDMLQALAEARQALEWRPISEAPKGEDCIGGSVFVDLMSRHNRFPNCFYDWATGYWTMRVQYKTKAGARKTVCNALKTDESWTFREIPAPPSVKEG